MNLPTIKSDKFDDNDLRVLSMVSPNGVRTQALLPQDRLQAIIATTDDLINAKASEEKATELAKILIGCYPRANVENPDVYIRGIRTVMEKFPAAIVSRAVDTITMNNKFLPTRAEVHDALAAEMGEIIKTKTRADMMRREGERRAKEAEEQAERAKSRQEFRDKHGDKSPMDVLKSEGIIIGESKRKN